MRKVSLSKLVQKIESWNPSVKIPNQNFHYVDLSAVDKENKSINENLIQFIEGKEAPSRARQKLLKHDILISTVRPNLNGLGIIECELTNGTASTGFCVLRVGDDLDYKFLYYWLQTDYFVNDMVSKATGANYPAVSDRIILQSQIPLPPLSEQKRIAELLDAADSLRKKDKALLEKYDQLAQSLFLEMFGDPVKNEKGWEVKKLGDVISKLETGVSVNSTDEKFNGNSFGILKTSCVYTGEFREMEAKVILENEISRAKLNPKKDSLIVSRMNTSELVGKSAYVDKDYPNLFLPDRLWQTVPGSSDCNFRWLHYVLNHSSFMDSISKIASGTSGSMKNISKQSFLNLVCIYPNFSLQNQFAEQVQLIEKQKEIAKKNLEKSEELMKGLMGGVFG